jgi:pyruvate/2-oxoacid:ferredoxin oxidoreductase beta subunit/Pyruvate/2-oxoacid:ferredoxin oxidoreductase gamma subunit
MAKYPFCPGCSHSLVIDKLKESIESLNIPREKLVLVTDIGCIGISDKYFDINTFHGLHGRCITYATGIKLMRPELHVIALLGDGGIGIGGNHFIHAARRNIGITLIVANNFNFGMTGGQHSVTTPHNGKTGTTPDGNIEHPIDICNLAIASGATFVARTTGFDENLTGIITKAIMHNGFSVVDTWEICVAYYMLRNNFKKADLEKLIKEEKIKTGIIHQEDKDEFASLVRSRQIIKGKEKQLEVLPVKYKHNLKKDLKLVIAGSAGMRIRTAGRILGRAGILSGLYALQRDDYPITVMTGHSVSEIILSPLPIYYAGIDYPDALLLISQDGLKRESSRINKMDNTQTIYLLEKFKDIQTDAKKIVIQIPNGKNTALEMVSFFVRETGILPMEALEESKEIEVKARE